MKKKDHNRTHLFVLIFASSLTLGCASGRSIPLFSGEELSRNFQSSFYHNAMSGDGNLVYTVYAGKKIWQYNIATKTQKVVFESNDKINNFALIPGQDNIFFVTSSNSDDIKEFKFFYLNPKTKMATQVHTVSGKSFAFCGFDEPTTTFSYLFRNEHNSRKGLFMSSMHSDGTLKKPPELIVDPDPYIGCGYFTAQQTEYIFDRYESITTQHLLSQNMKTKTMIELVNKHGVTAAPDEHFNLESGGYFIGNFSSDTHQVYTVSNGPLITQKTFGKWDVTQFLYAVKKKLSMWITNEDGYSILNIGDHEFKPLQKVNLPFTQFSIYGMSDDERFLLMRAATSVSDFELFRYEWQTGDLVQLTAFNSSQIKAEHFAPAKTVQITSSDGLRFSAVAYQPPADIKNNIAIIDVHGGPHSQSRPTYDKDAQYLVNKGFTVIQPNYRGSRGYGTSFERSIHKDWGGAHMLDIAATRNFLIAEMGFKPEKIAIFGSSFGGYTAAVAAVKTGTDYCAAISGFGLYNLLSDIEQVPGWDKKSILETIGSAVRDRELLITRSPIFEVEKIQTPVLIFYGEQDKNVLKNQSEEFIKKLNASKKVYSEIVFENEGHGFKSGSNFVLYLKEVANFVRAHCSKQ